MTFFFPMRSFWISSFVLVLMSSLALADGGKPDTYPSLDSGRSGGSHASSSGYSSSGEDWKGSINPSAFGFSALGGIGVIDDYRPGFALIGAIHERIIDHGFVPGINNSVYIEGELGPVFAAGNTAWFYSAHLRWDFTLNSDWIFYALGGVAGSDQGSGLGNHTVFYPRIGAGAIMNLTELVGVRLEISHELIVLGAMIRL
jgi:opacity protein-like surface antigen